VSEPAETQFLDLEDLLLFTELLGAGPVRDAGLLDSAAARARSSAFGQDAYPTLELKAAALLHSISKNHALVDGNKRLALLATATFLRTNGYPFQLTQAESFNLIMEVAEGRLDLPDIAARLYSDGE
jgi:death-on-curing protein